MDMQPMSAVVLGELCLGQLGAECFCGCVFSPQCGLRRWVALTALPEGGWAHDPDLAYEST